MTFNLAKELQLKGKPVQLEIVTVGGQAKEIDSYRYKVQLVDKAGCTVEIEALGIDQISTDIQKINIDKVKQSFTRKEVLEIERPAEGVIDLLVGFEYAGYHPRCIESVGHLLLMKNQFAYIMAGSHPDLQERTKRLVHNATVLHATVNPQDFYDIESLGVSCVPSCGPCKCGKCHSGGKNMTLVEERELKMVESGLNFSPESGRWVSEYPWIEDPNNLPNNRYIAYATLKSLEKRLERNSLHAETYKRQIDDMLDRNVARLVTQNELSQYKGPKFYLSQSLNQQP